MQAVRWPGAQFFFAPKTPFCALLGRDVLFRVGRGTMRECNAQVQCAAAILGRRVGIAVTARNGRPYQSKERSKE